MPGFAVPYNQPSFACTAAASACDDLAGKLEDQIGKLGSLRGDVVSTWQGDGGASLDGAVGRQADALRGAVNSLRAAARTLRAAASEDHH